jgi:hypothetical protein
LQEVCLFKVFSVYRILAFNNNYVES